MVARIPLPDQGAAGPVPEMLTEPGTRWLQRTLDRLVEHVRSLLRADAIALTVVDADQHPALRGGVVGARRAARAAGGARAPVARRGGARARPAAAAARRRGLGGRAGPARRRRGGARRRPRRSRLGAVRRRLAGGRAGARRDRARARRADGRLARPGRAARRRRTCTRSRCWRTSPRWRSSAPSCSTPRPAARARELQLKRAAEAISASLEPDGRPPRGRPRRRGADRRQQGAR